MKEFLSDISVWWTLDHSWNGSFWTDQKGLMETVEPWNVSFTSLLVYQFWTFICNSLLLWNAVNPEHGTLDCQHSPFL